jgi:hypothetical protein
MNGKNQLVSVPLGRDCDLDVWLWRLQTLEDLFEFEAAHGPASSQPLPTIEWELCIGRHVRVDLPGSGLQTLVMLSALADALGTTLRARPLPSGVLYSVHGRIGTPVGADRVPRTELWASAFTARDVEESRRQPGVPLAPEQWEGTA